MGSILNKIKNGQIRGSVMAPAGTPLLRRGTVLTRESFILSSLAR